MKLGGRAPRIARLSPVLLGSLGVLVAMDLLYVASYAINLKAYHLAPNNGAVQPGDDP